MNGLTLDGFMLVFAPFLVALNGLFVAAECSFVKIRASVEFDEEEPHVERLEDGSFAMDGRIPIGSVNEVVGSEFDSEDFDTIGGLVLGQIGRTPEVGDEVRLESYLLRVDEADGPRVVRVRVKKEPL